MNESPAAVKSVANTRARDRKMTLHRLAWGGLVMFGVALMGIAVVQALDSSSPEPQAATGAQRDAVSSAGSGVPFQPRWTGVLGFGAVVTGIGLLGFIFAGGFGAVADFMRSDP